MKGTCTDVETRLTHPSVRVSYVGRTKVKARFIGVISGLAGRAEFTCFSNTIENAKCAVLERVFFHKEGGGFARPHIPSSEVVTSYLKPFLDAFLIGLTTTVPVSLDVYPETNYRGRKLILYKKARDVVRGRTMGDNVAYIKAFIKHEKIMVKDKKLVPRVIQPRSPEYNVLVGRYIRQLEHRIYDRIERVWGGPTVMKGRNCVQQGRSFSGAWASFAEPVAIMLDAVRFDQHVSIPILQWEHGVYLKFFTGDYRAELKHWLGLQLHNRGRVVCDDGTLTYSIDGCRASGDMNTSMGNVVIMCAAIYGLKQRLGCKMRLLNNGDDCCLIVERADLRAVMDAIPEYFRDLGFIIDIEGTADCLERVGFCQTHPVFDGSDWVMTRDFPTAISKDVTILRKWTGKEYRAYLHQLGVSGTCAYGNMPVFKAFYECLRRSDTSDCSQSLLAHVRGAIEGTGLARLATDTHREGPITDACRASFAVAFSITPDTQRYWERYFESMSAGTSELFPGIARHLML